MKTLIKAGHIVDPSNKLNEVLDIVVVNKKISEVGQNLTGQFDKTINAEGLYIFPGLVDAHCHLREPGFEYKEDIASGTLAAAKGGFTAVACMPNTKPVADSDAVIKFIVDKAAECGHTKVYPIGSITKGSDGEQLADMGFMKEAGAVAVSDDGRPVENADVMRKALEYSKDFNLPVISHCEEMSLAENGSMNEGFLSTTMGLMGIPSIAEEIQVSRDVLLAEYTGVPVHIAHISTEGSARIIRDAKNRGVKITCETCPHYFSLTEVECEGFNTNAKVNPPLRGESDRQAIIEAIKDGTIDMIVTDHAPHHRDEKNVEFEYAANGISGFETAFAASYTYLVKPGRITIDKLVELMSLNPAAFLSRETGGIKVGSLADITIADIKSEATVNTDEFVSKGKNTPFAGKKLSGQAMYTLVNGKVSYDGGNDVC
ncbi:MAG: dihydroorotase [Clostridiales bacterium]|nr:dihydroorotase [Clostridiales bacterium]